MEGVPFSEKWGPVFPFDVFCIRTLEPVKTFGVLVPDVPAFFLFLVVPQPFLGFHGFLLCFQ